MLRRITVSSRMVASEKYPSAQRNRRYGSLIVAWYLKRGQRLHMSSPRHSAPIIHQLSLRNAQSPHRLGGGPALFSLWEFFLGVSRHCRGAWTHQFAETNVSQPLLHSHEQPPAGAWTSRVFETPLNPCVDRCN